MSSRKQIPAFPIVTGQMTQAIGMDLRDYFAAAALQGMLSYGVNLTQPREIADDAYRVADAMLDQREKQR